MISTEGEDYVYYGSPITINDPSKSFQVCINFTIVDDEVSEGPENISVHLDLSMMSDASGALDIQRVATIIINDNVGKKLILLLLALYYSNTFNFRLCRGSYV